MGSILKAMGASGEEKKSGINSPWGWLTEPFTLFGIRFAPLWLPLERRLQTAAVLFWILLFTVSPSLTMFILYYTIAKTTYFKWVGILYTAWYIYDFDTCNKGGRRIRWLRNTWLQRNHANYFSMKLVKSFEGDLDPKKNYLFCSHPHGMFCIGLAGCFLSDTRGYKEMFPGLRPYSLILNDICNAPGMREVIMATGGVTCSEESMDHILSSEKGGEAPVLVVGGVREMTLIENDRVELYIMRRKGFVRKALENGASLVPTFTFGENFTFTPGRPNAETDFPDFRKLQNKILDITPPGRFPLIPLMNYGRGLVQYTMGLIPHRRQVTVVVGAPIVLEKIAKPSKEEINAVHAQYLEKLKELYDTHCPQFGYNVPLVFK